MQSDYFGAAAEPENGRVRSRPDSPTPSGPARKVQKRNSIASNGSNEDNKDDDDAAAGDASVDGAGGPMPNGPPFICPTCSTSYSRLEYLRRHERRRKYARIAHHFDFSCFKPTLGLRGSFACRRFHSAVCKSILSDFYWSLCRSHSILARTRSCGTATDADIRPFVCDCGKGFSRR